MTAHRTCGVDAAQTTSAIVVNAPAFFADPGFVRWLNNGHPKFTWHNSGAPSEWSDVIVLVDPSLSGEGSDSDMPPHIWEEIVRIARDHAVHDPCGHHILVWLKNLRGA